MPVAVTVIPAQSSGHLVLDGVSWAYYEQTLREIGDRPVRVAFDQGRIEIMSPLPEHEICGNWMGRLIETAALEWDVEVIASARQRSGIRPGR